MAKQVTLVSPSGEDYQTSTPAEVVRLKALGYTEKSDKPAKTKTDTK